MSQYKFGFSDRRTKITRVVEAQTYSTECLRFIRRRSMPHASPLRTQSILPKSKGVMAVKGNKKSIDALDRLGRRLESPVAVRKNGDIQVVGSPGRINGDIKIC